MTADVIPMADGIPASAGHKTHQTFPAQGSFQRVLPTFYTPLLYRMVSSPLLAPLVDCLLIFPAVVARPLNLATKKLDL